MIAPPTSPEGRRVVAAIDASPVAGTVISVAELLAPILGATTEVVTTDPLCRELHGPLVRLLDGDAPGAVLDHVEGDPRIPALVLGVRTLPGGPVPAGHVALSAMTTCSIPVVVVPPRDGTPIEEIRRVLVPVEGESPPSPAVTAMVDRFAAAGVAVDTVHVFDRSNAPMFWNGWDDPGLWAEQFSERYSPTAGRPATLLVGSVPERLLDAVVAHESSMVILEWKRHLGESAATVVRHLLASSGVPVLLLPEAPSEPDTEAV